MSVLGMALHRRTWWSPARRIDLLCWALLAFMAWFAVRFSAERMLGDAAYFLLCMVDRSDFFVSHGRWIMPFSQWLAVIGIKAIVPMKALIALYSLGSVVVATLAYLFVRLVLKDQRAGMAVVGTQLIGVGHAVFCPVFEFYYAAPLLVTCLALLRTTRLPPLPQGTLFAALLFFVLSSHFLAMIVTMMVLIMAGVHRHPRLALIAVIVVVVHSIIRATVLSDYELRAISSLWIRLDGLGWTWVFRPGRLIGHLHHALSVYPDVVFLSVLFVMALLHVRAWFVCCAFLGGLLVLYVLQSFYFPDGTHTVYREFVDYPFAAWVVVFPYILSPAAVPGLGRWQRALGLMLVLRCMLWLVLSGTYVDRVEWMRDRIAAAHEQGIRRGVVMDQPAFITPYWGSVRLPGFNPMEVVLLSAEAGPAATVMLIPMQDRTATMQEVDAALDEGLPTGHIPLIWDSPSPYFDLPRVPLQVLR